MSEAEDLNELFPLRLSWPQRTAVEMLCRRHHAEFARACETMRARIPGCQCATVDKLNKEVAMSLANGFLSRVLAEERAGPDQLARFLEETPALRTEAWLSDLFLVAACIQGDSAANRALTNLIEGEIAQKINDRFRSNPAIVDEVLSDLSSHLQLPTSVGFNRGRPRLASFCGGAKLATWLKGIALNRGIDLLRKWDVHGMTSLREEADARPAPPPSDEPPPLRKEMLERSLRLAVGRLLRQLQELKTREPHSIQFDFFLLRIVEGKSSTETAQQLAIGLPRATELANTICKKLCTLLIEADPRWEALSTPSGMEFSDGKRSVPTESRKSLETWLERLFDFEGLDHEPLGAGDHE